MFDEIRGGTAPTPTGDAEDLFGLLDDEEASDLVDLNLALRSERGLRRTPPPMQQQRGERGARGAPAVAVEVEPALSRSPAKPAPTRYERPTRAMISRFGAASGSGDDDYDYDDERKASPARPAFDARDGAFASAPVDFRPVGGVASPETTLDLPPESPVGKAKASASPAKLGQSRSARSLLWSSVESVGLDDDRGGGSFDDDDPPRLRDAPPRPKPSSARGKPKLRRASPDKPASAKAGRGNRGPVPDLVVVNGSPSATKPAGRKSAGSGGRKHRDDRDEHRGPGGLFRRDGDDGPPRGDRVASADPSQRSWRSSSARGHRSAVGAAAASSAKRGATRQKINSASAAHRQQRVKEFQVLQGAASPASPRLTVRSRRDVADFDARRQPPPSPMAARYDVDPPGGVHEVLGSAIVGDDDDWGETRDPGGGGFGDWPPASPLGHFHRPPSRQKGAFPTHLMAGDGARRDLDDRYSRRRGAWKSNLQPDFNWLVSHTRDEPPPRPSPSPTRDARASARDSARRRRDDAAPKAAAANPGGDRVVFEGDETKKTLRRPPSRQKMPKAALFLDIDTHKDARQLPLGPATFGAPKARASGPGAWMRSKMPRYAPGELVDEPHSARPDLAPKVADVADEPAPRGRKPSISQVDAPAAPPAVAPPAPTKSRAPEDDVDRHHDPEADGFTAIDEPTPCPFRIQVTQNDGRSTVLLDDLGARAARARGGDVERRRGRRAGGALERDRAPGRRAAAGLRGPGRRAGVRGGARRADADGQGVGLGALRRGRRRRGPTRRRRTASRGGRRPRARAAARPRAPAAPVGDPVDLQARGAPRRDALAIFHGGAHLGGATPARKASAKVGAAIGAYDFSGKEELKRRLVADQAGLGGKGPLTLKRSPKPVVERGTSSPAVAAEPEAAPPADAFGGLELAAPGSGDSLGSDEDDLLEVASGSSFNDDDDNQLGAQMLETNLGEEFLSLFAPITH
ncbi:hypothetical protein JL722_5029 [Aureococcus anophagefferens]|nr:hypothetical protein JL722_5029 [Aureococcus anophagefferens]